MENYYSDLDTALKNPPRQARVDTKVLGPDRTIFLVDDEIGDTSHLVQAKVLFEPFQTSIDRVVTDQWVCDSSGLPASMAASGVAVVPANQGASVPTPSQVAAQMVVAPSSSSATGVVNGSGAVDTSNATARLLMASGAVAAMASLGDVSAMTATANPTATPALSLSSLAPSVTAAGTYIQSAQTVIAPVAQSLVAQFTAAPLPTQAMILGGGYLAMKALPVKAWWFAAAFLLWNEYSASLQAQPTTNPTATTTPVSGALG